MWENVKLFNFLFISIPIQHFWLDRQKLFFGNSYEMKACLPGSPSIEKKKWNCS